MIKLKKPMLVIFAILWLFEGMTGQNEYGAHPLGQQWSMMTSDAVRVIYPLGMESKAQRIASIINYMDNNNLMSIGKKKKRIDIVLQNQTTNPNGYVTLAPFRSEFYTTAPQNNLILGSMDWLDALTIHEFRHVQQIANSRRGLTYLQSIFGGQLSWAGANAFSMPNWYSEGDAVIAETALTNNGRGRMPFFSMEQRALALAQKHYPYSKHRNGSYDDLIPDQYRLGYLMLSKMRKEFGNEVPMKIMHLSANQAGLLWAFARSMNVHTSMTPRTYFKKVWNEQSTTWNNEARSLTLTPSEPKTDVYPSVVTRNKFPIFIDEQTFVCRKSSYDKTEALYEVHNGHEKKLTDIGFTFDDFISHSNGLIAWTEYSNDKRRNFRNYSNIILYNLKNNQKKKLTSRSRYFSPSIDHQATRLATIHITTEQAYAIDILNIHSGKVVKTIHAPKDFVLSRTAWSMDDEWVITVAKYNNQMSLMKVKLDDGSFQALTPWSNHTIESPSVHGDIIYFNASFSGIDNIYCTSIVDSNTIFQVTSDSIGAFDPSLSPDGKTLLFAAFNHKGYYIASIAKPDFMLQAVIVKDIGKTEQYMASEGGNILEKFTLQQYPSSPYKGLFTGMKFHSWSIIPDASLLSLKLYFDNLLNDFSIQSGIGYNVNENNGLFIDNSIRLARYYPDILLTNRVADRSTQKYDAIGQNLISEHFREILFSAGVSIPWTWISGNYLATFTPSVGIERRMRTNVVINGELLAANDGLTTINASLLFSKVRRTARQNAGPRGGFSFTSQYILAINGVKNNKITSQAKIYLPGIMSNHAGQISMAYQSEPLKNVYQFSDQLNYARGYSIPANDEYMRLSANYMFPLLYPDFNIMGLTYFKRIRANLFYDYGMARLNILDQNKKYQSLGTEIIFDNQFINLVPASLGLRWSYKMNPENDNGKRLAFQIFANIDI